MKQTVFRKVYVKDRLPINSGWYDTNVGRCNFYEGYFDVNNRVSVEWFLEEIELPSEEEIIEQISELPYDDNMSPNDVGIQGANYILNKLK